MDLGWLAVTPAYLWLGIRIFLYAVDALFWACLILPLLVWPYGHLQGRLLLFRRLYFCDPRYFHRGVCFQCVRPLGYPVLLLRGSRYTLDLALSDANYLVPNWAQHGIFPLDGSNWSGTSFSRQILMIIVRDLLVKS